jgi:hypothetical protein
MLQEEALATIFKAQNVQDTVTLEDDDKTCPQDVGSQSSIDAAPRHGRTDHSYDATKA